MAALLISIAMFALLTVTLREILGSEVQFTYFEKLMLELLKETY